MADITPLLPYVNEPYRQDAVVAAARGIPAPFILREMVNATGLPTPVVHRVLGRLVKKGLFTRFKVKATYPGLTGAGNKGRQPVRWIAGGRQRRVWAYMPVESEAE